MLSAEGYLVGREYYSVTGQIRRHHPALLVKHRMAREQKCPGGSSEHRHRGVHIQRKVPAIASQCPTSGKCRLWRADYYLLEPLTRAIHIHSQL